ncbi:hypothetical protein GCM10027514_26800 [Azotobacter armeniacus]
MNWPGSWLLRVEDKGATVEESAPGFQGEKALGRSICAEHGIRSFEEERAAALRG